MRRVVPGVVLLSLSACGGTPTQPPPAQPLTWTLTGQIISTATGQPVGAATITTAAGTTISSADGRYTLGGTAPAPLRVTISAPGYVTRETFAYVDPGNPRDLTLDIIRDAAPFNRDLWEELARDRLDNSGQLRPLAPWTGNAPTYWIKTTDERGTALAPGTIARIKDTIITAVQTLSGNRWTPTVTLTTGSTTDRPSGAIAVDVLHATSPRKCGEAAIGALTKGYINLYVGTTGCSCNGDPMGIEPVVIAHETAHTLGAFHVSDPGALMNLCQRCTLTGPTEAERYHAAILFQRPRGNTAPDTDPQGTAQAQADSPAGPLICRLPPLK